jgi:uncharacterized protein YuzE
MQKVRIPIKGEMIGWEYDEAADVLYLSLGDPGPAVGVDLGEGIVLRYDECRQEVVGLTLIGLRARLMAGLASDLVPPGKTWQKASGDDLP